MTNSNDNSDNHRDYEPIGERVRIFQRGGKWYANFQHEGRQHRQSLKTGNKKEARRRAIRLEAALMNGQFPGAVNVPTLAATIGKYLAYLKSEGRAPKTLQKYQKVFDRLEELADRRRVTKISGVNLELIDAYKSQRTDDKAAKKTIHTETVVIRQLVNFAVSRDMITADPLKKLKLKRPKLRPQPCWSRQEVEKIVAAAQEPQQSMLAILAETGMRVGELKWLTRDDIDFEHGVILIREKDGWKPKTGDQRAIPMTPALRAVLQRLPHRARWVVTAAPSTKHPKGDHQISARRLLEYLKRVLKGLGLRGHLHAFRHSFISNALTQGIPEAIVRQWVGHVDPELIKLYTHILDEASQTAMQRLAEANNPKPAPKGKEVSNGCKDAESAQIQHKAEDGQKGDSAK